MAGKRRAGAASTRSRCTSAAKPETRQIAAATAKPSEAAGALFAELQRAVSSSRNRKDACDKHECGTHKAVSMSLPACRTMHCVNSSSSEFNVRDCADDSNSIVRLAIRVRSSHLNQMDDRGRAAQPKPDQHEQNHRPQLLVQPNARPCRASTISSATTMIRDAH